MLNSYAKCHTGRKQNVWSSRVKYARDAQHVADHVVRPPTHFEMATEERLRWMVDERTEGEDLNWKLAAI